MLEYSGRNRGDSSGENAHTFAHIVSSAVTPRLPTWGYPPSPRGHPRRTNRETRREGEHVCLPPLLLLSLFTLSGRLLLGTRPRVIGKKAGKNERQRLLAEVEELERARLRGEIGPKTYERARREVRG